MKFDIEVSTVKVLLRTLFNDSVLCIHINTCDYDNASVLLVYILLIIVLKSSWGTSPWDHALTMDMETVSNMLDFGSKLKWLDTQQGSITFISYGSLQILYNRGSVIKPVY